MALQSATRCIFANKGKRELSQNEKPSDFYGHVYPRDSGLLGIGTIPNYPTRKHTTS
jgi:hypothetical protein